MVDQIRFILKYLLIGIILLFEVIVKLIGGIVELEVIVDWIGVYCDWRLVLIAVIWMRFILLFFIRYVLDLIGFDWC